MAITANPASITTLATVGHEKIVSLDLIGTGTNYFPEVSGIAPEIQISSDGGATWNSSVSLPNIIDSTITIHVRAFSNNVQELTGNIVVDWIELPVITLDIPEQIGIYEPFDATGTLSETADVTLSARHTGDSWTVIGDTPVGIDNNYAETIELEAPTFNIYDDFEVKAEHGPTTTEETAENANKPDEAYFVPGGSVTDTQVLSPYADPADLVKSYCAHPNGTSDFATLTAPITIASTFNWTIEFFHVHAASQNDRVILGSTAKSSSYGVLIRSNTLILLFDDGSTLGTNTLAASLEDGKTYKISISWTVGTPGIHRVEVWNVSDNVLHSDQVSSLTGPNFNLALDLIGKRGINDRYAVHPWFDLRITTPTDSLHIPAQGSLLDVSGNNNHAINSGMNLYQRQDFFHYNIREGFDKYLEDGEDGTLESHYIYVPYAGGTPVVASLAGYTEISSNPAGNWHNQAETFLRFPLATDFFDKSDVALWPASIRARDEYDSTNPTDWAGWELGAFNLTEDSAGLDTENKVFSLSDPNEYSYTGDEPDFSGGTPDVVDEAPLTKVSHVLGYLVEKTQVRIRAIIKYFKEV